MKDPEDKVRDLMADLMRSVCKHERANFCGMHDDGLRQLYKCIECGWEHYCAVDPVTGDIVNVDARTGVVQEHR